MISFKEVLGQVRRTLREASPVEIQGLLAELMEARVLSRDYCLSLAQEQDSEDMARRISLPVWQNWELCHGAIGALLDRVRDYAGAVCQSSSFGPGMQEILFDSLEFLDNVSMEDLADDHYPVFSPNPSYDLAEDRGLNESIEGLIQLLSEEDPISASIEPSLPEPSTWEPLDWQEQESKKPVRKRGCRDSASPTGGDSPTKRSKQGHKGGGLSKKTRNEEALFSPPSMATLESVVTGITDTTEPKQTGATRGTTSPHGSVTQPPTQGVFQISLNTNHQLLPLSITNISTFGCSAFLNPCKGATAIQIIPAVTYPQQVINISVPKVLNTGAPTYVLVPQPPLTPVNHIMPQSPGAGAAVPSDLLVSTPASSCSDTAFQVSSPELTPTPSPIKDVSSCKEPLVQTPPPEPSPEKPKCVEDYINTAKAWMRESSQRTDLENETSMESLYIDVPLVQRQIQHKPGKNASKCLEKVLVMLSNADRRKATLLKSHLLQDTGQVTSQVVALLGKGGMGKTVFVWRLCLDWSDGNLPQFEYVFLLDSKVLNLPHTNYSLKSLLFNLSCSPPCKNTSAVFRHVLSVPQKVLVIFDGFDDFRDPEGLLHSPATCNTKDSFSVKQLFSGLFQKKLLRGCTLLISARPKGVFNQFLAKVDRIMELCGFSSEDIGLYISRYFKDPLRSNGALKKLKTQRYLFSHCTNPLICRYTCFLLKHSDRPLPLTLTGLFHRVLGNKMHLQAEGKEHLIAQKMLHLTKLSCIAWAGVKTHNSILNLKESAELKEFGLSCGLLTTYTAKEKDSDGRLGYGFSHPILQSFLAALHLVQSRDVSDKALVAQMTPPQKKRRPQTEWLDITRRFALGLLFQKGLSLLEPEPGTAETAEVKRGAAAVHLQSLKPCDMGPARLLELCHCAFETGNTTVTRHLLKSLPEDLRFCGVQLTPADVFVLQHLLQKARNLKRTFSIDLQDTSINLQGLKDILGLKCILSFRASIVDTITLWENLQKNCEIGLLKSTVAKFTISPFKATHLDDVANLVMLAQIYRGRRLSMGDQRLEPTVDGDTFDVPAVRNLQKLELSLGPSNGPVGFSKLVEALSALQCLQHLDLENNKIGDSGAEQLAEILSALTSLEMLNLSQNCIGDRGLEKLAVALPSLSLLHSLSLYSNFICDSGAESLAKVLPDIKSLTDLDVTDNSFTDVGAQSLSHGLKKSPRMKTVRMWNHYIPHGVLEHLKQQDSRITSL